jgi:hypothetical protein
VGNTPQHRACNDSTTSGPNNDEIASLPFRDARDRGSYVGCPSLVDHFEFKLNTLGTSSFSCIVKDRVSQFN